MTANRSELILNYETTNQKSIKLSSMLPSLEGICEMGHHQQNLTLASSLKMINVHYVALLLGLAALYSSNFSSCAAG